MSDDPPGASPPRDRRAFLRRISALGAAISGVIIGVPSLLAFLSPAFKRTARPDWIKVAEADLVDIDTPVKVDFVQPVQDAWVESRALRSVWLRTEDGESFTAFSGSCTHLGCSFGYDATRKIYVCPCHHGEFDPKTGAVLAGPPPRPLDTLPVKVVESEVFVLFQQFRAGVKDKIAI